MASIFSKVIHGEIKGAVIYQDEHCAALVDIQPQAPTHLLIVPKREIPSLAEAGLEDEQILGHLLLTASRIARDQGLAHSGYRVVINVGEDAGMTVPHLHVHLLGGRHLSWPPG